MQITHRNIWVNATTFALHAGVTDRDVYLHTLPMFHANGWGMPFATTGLGVPQIVLRKVDGADILRRVEQGADAHAVETGIGRGYQIGAGVCQRAVEIEDYRAHLNPVTARHAT